jgi:hypothetical protein
MNNGLLIGIGAGLVSGLILASASGGSVAALFILFFLSPLPIAITGLGWGWYSALAASIAGAGVLGVAIAPKTAFFHLFAIGLPLTVLCYLTLLNRATTSAQPPAYGSPPQVQLEWYPIGRVVAAASLMAGALAAAALLSVATDSAGLEAEIRKLVERLASAPVTMPEGAKPLGPAEIETFSKLMTANFGAATATTWLVLASLNIWLGGHIARVSGLLQRPWPDLSTIRAPKELSLAFILAVILSFIPDYPGLIASSFAGAIMMAYVFVGLAFVHNVTRGNSYRGLILSVSYAALIFLQPLSAFAFAMLALSEPLLPFRRQGPFDTDLPPPPPT